MPTLGCHASLFVPMVEEPHHVLADAAGLPQLRGRCPFSFYAAALARRLGPDRPGNSAAAMRALVDAFAERAPPPPAAAAAAAAAAAPAASSSSAAAARKRGAL
jgi:hypothetical protein